MPELPPQLPSWSGALGFPRACSGLSHFSSLFCYSMVYPWEFAGSVPSGVLFEVQGLGVAFSCRSRGAVGTALLLGRSHCSYVSHSSPAHCRPPLGGVPSVQMPLLLAVLPWFPIACTMKSTFSSLYQLLSAGCCPPPTLQISCGILELHVVPQTCQVIRASSLDQGCSHHLECSSCPCSLVSFNLWTSFCHFHHTAFNRFK